MWSDCLVFCDCGFSLSALWCPLLVPTFLLGFLLPWTWDITWWPLLTLDVGYLLRAAVPDLGHGVSPLSHHSWPWTWGISSWPFLPHAATTPEPHPPDTDFTSLLVCGRLQIPVMERWEGFMSQSPRHSHMHVFTQEKFILDDGCVFLSEGHWMGFYLKSPGGVFFCWFSKMKGVAWGQVNTLPDLVSPGPPRGCKVVNCPHSFCNLLNKQITELLWASISSSIEWEKSVSHTHPNLRELCYHLIANIK